MNSAIDTADLELAKAILTGYVRQERFCDGLLESAIKLSIGKAFDIVFNFVETDRKKY